MTDTLILQASAAILAMTILFKLITALDYVPMADREDEDSEIYYEQM